MKNIIIIVLFSTVFAYTSQAQKLFSTTWSDLYDEIKLQKNSSSGNVDNFECTTKGSANVINVFYKDGSRGTFWFFQPNGKLYHIAYNLQTNDKTIEKFNEIAKGENYVKIKQYDYKIKNTKIYFSTYTDDFNRTWYCWEVFYLENSLSE